MAAAAGTVKRVLLELGGKSANMILDDADLASIVPLAAVVRLLQRRAELHPPVAAARPSLAASTSAPSSRSAASARCPYGDPTDPDVFMGPLVSEAQRDRVEGYVEVGKADGARLLTGGSRAEDRGDGFFFEPTVFADVDPGSRLAQEEIFGPVLSVIPYDDDADAIEIANGTVYGLAAYVWSGDTERAVGVARRLRSGMVGVNGGSFIGAELPFGGIRQSGIGREWGVTGFEEFLEQKTLGVGGIGT